MVLPYHCHTGTSTGIGNGKLLVTAQAVAGTVLI